MNTSLIIFFKQSSNQATKKLTFGIDESHSGLKITNDTKYIITGWVDLRDVIIYKQGTVAAIYIHLYIFLGSMIGKDN